MNNLERVDLCGMKSKQQMSVIMVSPKINVTFPNGKINVNR
jgi:hypothetical protein